MLASVIPLSTLIGTAVEENELASALESAIHLPIARRRVFTHYDIIEGLPSSARLLLTSARPGSVPFPKEMNSSEMAEELIAYLPQARLPPGGPATSRAEKGWQVKRTHFADISCVVVIAGWVNPD